jgi:hypothetical protein
MPLAKRIIPCLDVDHGRVVKGVHFLNLKDAGDPVELAKRYSEEGADELVFLDITASPEKRKILKDTVERVAAEIDIPFTVGGGIHSLPTLGLFSAAARIKCQLIQRRLNDLNWSQSLRKPSVDNASSSPLTLKDNTRKKRENSLLKQKRGSAGSKYTHTADANQQGWMQYNGRQKLKD